MPKCWRFYPTFTRCRPEVRSISISSISTAVPRHRLYSWKCFTLNASKKKTKTNKNKKKTTETPQVTQLQTQVKSSNYTGKLSLFPCLHLCTHSSINQSINHRIRHPINQFHSLLSTADRTLLIYGHHQLELLVKLDFISAL